MERELTVEERLEAYMYAWIMVGEELCGICMPLKMFLEHFDFTNGYVTCFEVARYFPEFVKRRPKNKSFGVRWFPYTELNIKKRRAILDACIAECEQLLLTPQTKSI